MTGLTGHIARPFSLPLLYVLSFFLFIFWLSLAYIREGKEREFENLIEKVWEIVFEIEGIVILVHLRLGNLFNPIIIFTSFKISIILA